MIINWDEFRIDFLMNAGCIIINVFDIHNNLSKLALLRLVSLILDRFFNKIGSKIRKGGISGYRKKTFEYRNVFLTTAINMATV